MVVALISQLCSESLRKLEVSWTQVGYDEDQKEAERLKILGQLQTFLENSIEQANSEVSKLETQIEELSASTSAIYEELQEQFEPLPLKIDQITLKQGVILHKKALEVRYSQV